MKTEIPVGTPLIYDLVLDESGDLKAVHQFYLGEPQGRNVVYLPAVVVS